ncbi:MAG: rod shape-determining protein [Deferribacteraceae bacterium]|nr:rod shape-determining protein [Deferribacteraceae bacterium]
MAYSFLQRMFSTDIAIDLGTANTLVYVRGRGIVCNEPSVVAINNDTSEILAVGSEAKSMLGRTHGKIDAICPLQDGVISNFDITEKMLRYFIMKVYSRRPLIRPRMVICIPSCVTQVEKRAVRESAIQAGAREVYVVEEPMAAAIGAGLPIHEPSGNMVIDIGGGTTEVAVISLYGIVYSKSVRIAGNKMDENIVNYVKHKYNLKIGGSFAEQIKMHIGTAYPLEEGVSMEIKGNDIVMGMPTIKEITDLEIRNALEESVVKIVDAVKIALETITPEHAADIVDRGLVLTGGGALLKNLDKRLNEETGLPIIVSDNPLTAVVIGLGKVLENADLLKKVTVE